MAQKKNQTLNWYTSDVQVRGAYHYYASLLWDERGVDIKTEPGDFEALKEGAVDFFAFSYYMSVCVTVDETGQK